MPPLVAFITSKLDNGILVAFFVIITFSSCSNQPIFHFVEVQEKKQHVVTWDKGSPGVVVLNGGGSV